MKDCLTISIKEAGKIIRKKDRESIISWLNEKKVKIHTDKHYYVYELEVQMEHLRPLIIDCKTNYPHLWKNKLEILCNGNKQLRDLFLIELDSEHSISAPTTRIKPKNKDQEELYKRLYR